MLGTVDEIDYDGDRVRKVVLRFPALRAGDTEVLREVRACERIGQGSFGTVYRAVCEGYPRLALKIATGKSTRLRQELDVLSRVCTKGHLLLPRFEFGALNKTADLIVVGMELCVPSTLHDLLLSTRITSEAEMLFMAYQAVQAVACVHEAGCIHRDIKLQNFVFDLDGNLKLIDFGLACNSLSPPAGDVVAGTVSFMSPEMAHNALHKDRRVSVGVAADVWSLGIVLFSIFTQRNPYPSVETAAPAPPRGVSAEHAPRETSTGSDGNFRNGVQKQQQQPDLSAQHRMNERLLRRVAAGDWQWPVGVSVSEDLKQLVSSILVVSPEQRPTVQQVLQHKLWNLRRRYPPAAVAAFLGVQDDLLLSHDEAHLMRAVEERSAGVTASLQQSRVESPDTSASNASASAGAAHDASRHLNAARAAATAEGEEETLLPGASTPPVRGSLKVVQRGGEGGVDGAVAVQVYDVRASTRKRSRPIREISVVMAEETAKRQRAGRVGRQARTAASAPSSRRPSRAATAVEKDGDHEVNSHRDDDDVVVEEPRRASSAGATLHTASASTRATKVDDGWENEGAEIGEAKDDDVVEDVARQLAESASRSVSRSRSALPQTSKSDALNVDSPEKETDDAGERTLTGPSAASASTQPLMSMTFSSTQSRPSITPVAAETLTATTPREGNQRSGSVELVENSDVEETPLLVGRRRQSSNAGKSQSSHGGKTSSKRSRNMSLRQSSSSILRGVTRPLATASLPSAAEAAEAAPTTKKSSARVPSVPRAAAPAPPRTRFSVPPARPRRAEPQIDPTAVVREEVSRRRYLAAALLLEHAWLLASFRLTIEEDQERYNITWLAAEQEKSAAHPHRFKEMTRVTSTKYQYGFVCDLCDYEFLPYGRDKKSLHYFHCTCGRDLCPDCFEEYRRQCTCSCCRVVHPNSCELRRHLRQTGGTQLYSGLKGVARATAATHVDGDGTFHKGEAVALSEDEEEEDDVAGVSRKSTGRRQRTSARANGKAAKSPLRRDGSGRFASTTHAAKKSATAGRRRSRVEKEELDVEEEEGIATANNTAQLHLPRMSVAAMQQERVGASTFANGKQLRGRHRKSDAGATTAAAASSSSSRPPPRSSQQQQRPEAIEVRQRTVEKLPEGPWRPFARFRQDRQDEAARQPTPEERDALLNGDWIRHFYLFPNTPPDMAGRDAEEPYAFVYHAQPGRTGAIFLTSDFPMHSAIFSMLERQFFVVDQVDTVEGADTTRATSLLRAKGQPDLKVAFQALQEIVAYDTNMMKQQRTPGTVSVYQAPRSAYSCNGEPFLYVRWFRFNEDRTLSAFLLSNGAVQVFVNNEYELRWFDENRKFLILYNGVCELVEESSFTLAPAINHLLYDSFDA